MPVMDYIDAIRLAMKEEMERDRTFLCSVRTSASKAACSSTTKGLQRAIRRRARDGYSARRSRRSPALPSERPCTA